MIITETFRFVAADTDILKAPSRLAAIPVNGTLVIECSATKCDATNNAKLTLQDPAGDLPFEGIFIPANGYADDADVLHNDTELVITAVASQGGHFLLSIAVAGTLSVLMKVTLEF